MDLTNKIYIAWVWNNKSGNSHNLMVGNPDAIRKLSQALEKGNLILKSWVEFNFGTIITYGGTEGSASLPDNCLDRLKDIKDQAEGEVGMGLTFGLGKDLAQAIQALLVAKYQLSGDIVLWEPEIAELASKIKELNQQSYDNIAVEIMQKSGVSSHFVPHNKNTISGWAHKGPAAEPYKESGVISPEEPVKNKDQEDPVIEQLKSDQKKPVFSKQKINKDLIQILHQHAIKPKTSQNVVQNDNELKALKNKIAQLLMKIKEKVPNVAILRDKYPDLYDAYMIMAKAFVDLVKQIAKKHGLQKTELDLLQEYEPLLKVRFKLGTGLSNLPEGSIFDNRMKIIDAKTQKPKWKSLMAGMVRNPKTDQVASALNPDG